MSREAKTWFEAYIGIIWLNTMDLLLGKHTDLHYWFDSTLLNVLIAYTYHQFPSIRDEEEKLHLNPGFPVYLVPGGRWQSKCYTIRTYPFFYSGYFLHIFISEVLPITFIYGTTKILKCHLSCYIPHIETGWKTFLPLHSAILSSLINEPFSGKE